MPTIILDNLPFPQSDLDYRSPNTALGKFLTAWSQIEVVYSHMFRDLAMIDPSIAQTIYDRVGVREQLEILTEICEQILSDELRQKLIGLLDQVSKMSFKRNKIVHSRWGKFDKHTARYHQGLTSQHFSEIMKETQKGRSLREARIFTVDDINVLIAECISIRDALMECTFALSDIQIQQSREGGGRRTTGRNRHPALSGI